MHNSLSRRKLAQTFYARLLIFLLIWLAVFFLPAGTFAFWEAWVVLAILFIPMALGFSYWLKNDPELLERRSKTSEKEAEQKLIIKVLSLFFVLTFLIPGFDKRFGWSDVPVVVVVVADILVMLGYGICFFVVRENRFASRTVEVEQEQPVISSGLYAIVRHPMYLGVLLMCISLPLALGSYWAMVPALLIIPVLVARVRNEERVLVRELKGYQEYAQDVRYRLLPRVW
ncbi:MAG: isoprenylcysteine carboxylmethyltransferase family protein [Anaerolineae bacterium]|nr:isoprenylcysteine carboxylmethyltransferase family protein [Anaerolineae bacterium]